MELSLTCKIQPFVRVTRIKLVPKVWARIRVVVLRLPGVPAKLSADRGTVNTELARDLRATLALFTAEFDFDAVVKGQVTVVCGQGSAALQL